MGYRIWEEDGVRLDKREERVPGSKYAKYLERRAAALKAKGRTGSKTDIPESPI